MESGDYAEEESENSEKALATKLAYGLTFVEPSSEDEDLWPTYLDEYTKKSKNHDEMSSSFSTWL
ncbi:hypothetical protein C1H46_019611 [Malus baccata]|uniref:Uncharacterized protein n=1 Tax=Malus baccata TaxID=106549 RepID=A0A540M7N0_MALBA|nr:hypothetical protein C1H46_019611 [Malus baccata]